jgi:hypothetical protein
LSRWSNISLFAEESSRKSSLQIAGQELNPCSGIGKGVIGTYRLQLASGLH